MTERFALVPASYVLFLRADDAGREQVLLQLRQNTGYMDDHWASAAAGHVERGESAFAAAAREAAEEVGLSDVHLEPLCALHRTGRSDAIDERVDYFFAARSWRGEPRIVEPEKCADLRWFDLDDLPSPVVPHEAAVLTAVRSGDVPPVMTHGF